MAANEHEMHNPALDDLDVLVGRWRVRIGNAELLADGQSLSGTMTVSWVDGHALLLTRTVFEGGPPVSTTVVGRNEDRDEFVVLYADERGVSRVYEMTFDGRDWTQHREDPGFHQHFEARVAADGNEISAAWSKSHDGGRTWEHDFDLTYTRD